MHVVGHDLLHVFQPAPDGARAFGGEVDRILRLLQFFARLFEEQGEFGKFALEGGKQPPEFPTALFDGDRAEAHLQTAQKGVEIARAARHHPYFA